MRTLSPPGWLLDRHHRSDKGLIPVFARLTRLLRRRPAEAPPSRTLQEVLDSRTAGLAPNGGLLGNGLLRSFEPPATRLDGTETVDDESGRTEVLR
jgi:hypothetical protein